MRDASRPEQRERGASLGDKVVSGALWAAGASWLAPMMGAMMAAQLVRRPDRIEWLNRLYCWGQVRLTGSKWRAVVHPDVDPERQYMFCQNHVNHLDHCTMYNATPHFKQGIELAKHFEYPVYGWFMRQRGTIPVHPMARDGLERLRESIRRELEQGHSIMAFPEGHRTRDGRVRPFKKGLFRVARDLGLPIVPVAVTGMQDVMLGGSWLIRPGHNVTVHCEKPVETAGVTDAELPELIRRVRDPIVQRVDAYLGQQQQEMQESVQ